MQGKLNLVRVSMEFEWARLYCDTLSGDLPIVAGLSHDSCLHLSLSCAAVFDSAYVPFCFTSSSMFILLLPLALFPSICTSITSCNSPLCLKVWPNQSRCLRKITCEKFSITINGQRLEQNTRFSYLGSIRTEDRKCTKDIITRIARAKKVFNKRKELFNKRYNENLKKRIIKILIWSVLLYGCET